VSLRQVELHYQALPQAEPPLHLQRAEPVQPVLPELAWPAAIWERPVQLAMPVARPQLPEVLLALSPTQDRMTLATRVAPESAVRLVAWPSVVRRLPQCLEARLPEPRFHRLASQLAAKREQQVPRPAHSQARPEHCYLEQGLPQHPRAKAEFQPPIGQLPPVPRREVARAPR